MFTSVFRTHTAFTLMNWVRFDDLDVEEVKQGSSEPRRRKSRAKPNLFSVGQLSGRCCVGVLRGLYRIDEQPGLPAVLKGERRSLDL